jgi:hypothetical protein
MRIKCKVILFFAGDLIFIGNHLTGVAHMPVFKGAPQTVVDH